MYSSRLLQLRLRVPDEAPLGCSWRQILTGLHRLFGGGRNLDFPEIFQTYLGERNFWFRIVISSTLLYQDGQQKQEQEDLCDWECERSRAGMGEAGAGTV